MKANLLMARLLQCNYRIGLYHFPSLVLFIE